MLKVKKNFSVLYFIYKKAQQCFQMKTPLFATSIISYLSYKSRQRLILCL